MQKHECDLNIEWGEGANVIMCYNICDRDCSIKINSSLFAWFESIDFNAVSYTHLTLPTKLEV